MAVRKINIDDSEISVIFGLHDEDYICLTDMVKAGDNSDRTNIVIQNWMRRKDTISYLGVWENLHNPDFKSIEIDAIKNASGTNRFILTAKEWIERTGAIGIIAKSGRYGGTYAHKDIAYHFGMWLSLEFNLPVVKEFQRLKEEEQKALGWSAKRELASVETLKYLTRYSNNLISFSPIQSIDKSQANINGEWLYRNYVYDAATA
ncbi:MAG: KilA-N domain-containing protein [Paludibacteraceae bacterium]|nr:KilA-N domain-containing protein [Paludibacteraceae bacterium]MBQ6764513.1 KilA-N domain-containing protein [Paludibacteraceae bacterium]